MNKILLIHPDHDDERERYKHKSHRKIHRDPPPVGLLCIGTYLREHGFEVDIVDTHSEENYRELITARIRENNYLFAGITVIIGKFLKNAREITGLIRNVDPGLVIVWGGIMASIFPEECLKKYGPDYIVRFEGEETALELARTLRDKTAIEKVRGISYLKQGKYVSNPARIPKVNLDDYPVTRWDLLGNNFNREQIPYFFLLMSSRGCPFNCRFCSKHSIDEDAGGSGR